MAWTRRWITCIQELAIDPKELGGSAWEAALASFLLFAVGAIIPVLPFLFFAGPPGIYSSLAVSGVGLFVIGAGTTLFTARSVLWSTFGIGRLIGVSLSR
jgi:VIT1/CCC1 family predicted Fe2+/Mn2+ transporter